MNELSANESHFCLSPRPAWNWVECWIASLMEWFGGWLWTGAAKIIQDLSLIDCHWEFFRNLFVVTARLLSWKLEFVCFWGSFFNSACKLVWICCKIEMCECMCAIQTHTFNRLYRRVFSASILELCESDSVILSMYANERRELLSQQAFLSWMNEAKRVVGKFTVNNFRHLLSA